MAHPFAVIIVAAGKGLRAGTPVPKQFTRWRGKAVLRHSVEAFAAAGATDIIVAIPAGAEELAADCLDGIGGVQFVTGGETRQTSVHEALEAVSGNWKHKDKATPLPYILIHDAARPIVPQCVTARLIDALGNNPAAIPVLPVVDSLAKAEGSMMAGSAMREELRRVQTPQSFHFDAILHAHRVWAGAPDAGDDAQVAQAAGLQIALVEGDEALRKLTFAEDFNVSPLPPVRVGTGFDVHRLVAGKPLWLCGVRIEHSHGLSGHSDADVAIHAVVDALLGAIGAGDIGDHFPPSDPQWRGADSGLFLEFAAQLVSQSDYRIGNIDLTILCEAPRIGPHRMAMRTTLAKLASVDIAAVSVKATTTERLGFTGRGEGIAAQAAVCIVLKD